MLKGAGWTPAATGVVRRGIPSDQPTTLETELLRLRYSSVMDWMSVSETSAQLGVSPQRVRAMLHAGQLSGTLVGGRWLIDASTLPRARRLPGRPLSERVAWTLVEMADGRVASPLSSSEQSRLRSRWQTIRASAEPSLALHSAMARRAERSRWSAPDPHGLLQDPRVIPSGVSDPRSGMSTAGYAEGYVTNEDLDEVVADHLLVPARGPENVTLRATPRTLIAPLPWLLIAADLADGRAREAGQSKLLLRKYAPLHTDT